MATIIIEVDQKQAIAALRSLNRSIDDTGKKAEKGFGGAGTSIGKLTSPLSAATVGVGALAAAFVALAAVATKTFIDVTAKAVSLNTEAELTRIALIQIFEGNEAAADAFIDKIGDLAIVLGTSRQELVGIAKGILPDVGSIEGTEKILKNVIILGRDAGAHIDDIRRTLEGALVGQFEGFADVLNIPLPAIQKIRDLSKDIGIAAAITEVLGDRIQKQGLSIEAFADTLDILQNKLAAQFEDFQRILGVAPFEELKEQARGLLAVLEEKGPEIEIVAKAFGDLAANVIEFVGTNLTEFISSLDFEGIENLVDGFNDAIDAGKLLLDVFFDLDDANLFNDLISSLTTVTDKIKEALVTASQLTAIAKAEIAFTKASAQVLGIGGKLFASAEKEAEAAAAGQAAYNAVIKAALPAFEKFEDAEKKSEERTKDRRKAVEDTTEADKAAGQAILANKKAQEELADAQAKAADAQDEISKKTADAEADRQKRLTGIIRKEADRRFDDAIKSAQRREDIARKNVDAIEDIFRKNEQAIASAGTDLTQEEQDIARQGARDRRDIARDSANERVDIERNFRQELQRIQSQFNQDAEDAERNNDAQAFLRAVRSRDEQIQSATVGRGEAVEEAAINAERQREALAISLAAEVEDAKIANARKLEALQLRLNQELEAQALKVAREFEAETIREQRLKEQRDLELKRQLEDFARTEVEKQAKLQESLAAQVALIEAAAAKELKITKFLEAEKTKIVLDETAKRRSLLAATSAGLTAPGRGIQRFADGGRVPVGRPITVGEAGPEIFVPDSAGTIIPNDALFSPPSQPSMMGVSSSSITNNSPTFNLAESMFQDPIARRNLTNFVLGVLAEGG